MRMHKKIFALGLLAASLSLTGCLTDDDGDDKKNEPTPVTTRSLTAGAQSDTANGSAIDLDAFASYKIDSAKNIAAQIDLIFAYSTAQTSAAIYSPDSAKGGIGGSAGFDFLANFSPANATTIKTVTGLDLATITSKEQVDSLWGALSPVANGRLLVSAGTTFLAKSNLDLVVLVKVDSVVAGANGRGYLKGVAKF